MRDARLDASLLVTPAAAIVQSIDCGNTQVSHERGETTSEGGCVTVGACWCIVRGPARLNINKSHAGNHSDERERE